MREVPIAVDDSALRQAALTIARSIILTENHLIPAWRPSAHPKKSTCGFCPFVDTVCFAEDGEEHVPDVYPTLELWREISLKEFQDSGLHAKSITVAKELLLQMPQRRKKTMELIRKNGTDLARKLMDEGLLK